MQNFDFKPGSLVTLRNRPWIVMPSDDTEVLLLKPLGGSEEEMTGIFKPLAGKSEMPVSYNFRKPTSNDLGDFSSARLLYNASRLGFRNAAGPFRCLGKLSFRPRSYQMVPLIMALKQDTIRMFIADDVGVGKTIEALLIAKELYDRKEIKRFAVVCLPHLCDQWQSELKDKFGIEAVIIRSGTASGLERQIRAHENIFRAFPFQIISIDYIKTDPKRQVFLDHCPEMVLVDEAHTCARPQGATKAQQLRHHLIQDVAQKTKQHLVLLTATPHSGKQAEFQSLLGLLRPEFESIDIINSNDEQRKAIAKHFVQRRRADIIKTIEELNDDQLTFPERLPLDIPYEIGSAYAEIFNEILEYARDSIKQVETDKRKQRYSYWDALALLRGVMSSPAAGKSMLEKKSEKKRITDEEDDDFSVASINYDQEEHDEIIHEAESESVLDTDYSTEDNLPFSVLGKGQSIKAKESRKLLEFANRLERLKGLEFDHKAREAVNQVKDFIEEGYNPIVFCRYIQTANYVGSLLKEALKSKKYKDIIIEVVSSDDDDELRKEKIKLMNKKENARRLLISTDCLSEGIYLQDGFNAVLHYDLPWNPNRLEQREGRVDRFGQRSKTVKVALLYGSNNPIDGVVLEVLLRKAREIRKSIGIAVPFPENSASVMEAVTNSILLKPTVSIKQVGKQLEMFEDEKILEIKNMVAKALDEAEKREVESRSIFAQNAIKPNEIADELKEIDLVLGDVKTVEQFVVEALRFMGVQVGPVKDGYKVYATNLPQKLRGLLTSKPEVLISFKSPTPSGFKYIGRNHLFTEQLCQFVLNASLNSSEHRAARAAVVRTDMVSKKTTLFQFRVRNVIAEQPTLREIVAEEMWLWGYEGLLADGNIISKDKAYDLLMNVKASQNIEAGEQAYWLNEEMEWVKDEKTFRMHTDKVALKRAQKLVESHTNVRKLLRSERYKVVEPVLPMDLLGIYILLPTIN